MPDLTITAANVSLVSGEPFVNQIAAGVFTAGDLLHQQDDGRWRRAQCDGTAQEAGANRLGIALATADAAGARVSIAGSGCVVALGAGLAGVVYVPSRNLGRLAPTADMLATDRVTPFALGIGSGQVLLQRIYHPGSVLA